MYKREKSEKKCNRLFFFSLVVVHGLHFILFSLQVIGTDHVDFQDKLNQKHEQIAGNGPN